MRKQLVAVVVCLFSAVAAWSDAPFHREPNPVRDRYIVELKSDRPAAAHALGLANAHGGKLVHTYTTVLNGFSMQASEAAAIALTKNPNVEAVWEVGAAMKPTDVQSFPHEGLDRIDARSGLDNSYTYTMYTGAVTIYILDTGVDYQSEFGSRLIINRNFLATSTGSLDPNNYTDHGPGLGPQHGTTSAQLAAGATHGVAKFAKIANLRSIGAGDLPGSNDGLVAAIDFMANRARSLPGERHVANASWGQVGTNTLVENAIRNSMTAGNLAWAMAAGNDSIDACGFSPARLGVEYAGIMTVGAVDPRNDLVLDYSNQGSCVEIFAPSEVTIYSNWCSPDPCSGGGTSAAAPHVAGVFAARFGNSPTATPASIEGTIRSVATTGALQGLWPGSPTCFSTASCRSAAPSARSNIPTKTAASRPPFSLRELAVPIGQNGIFRMKSWETVIVLPSVVIDSTPIPPTVIVIAASHRRTTLACVTSLAFSCRCSIRAGLRPSSVTSTR
jgi:aqualysin 1